MGGRRPARRHCHRLRLRHGRELELQALVNYKRIPLYNAVNVLNGYNGIGVYSPLEVLHDDEDI